MRAIDMFSNEISQKYRAKLSFKYQLVPERFFDIFRKKTIKETI